MKTCPTCGTATAKEICPVDGSLLVLSTKLEPTDKLETSAAELESKPEPKMVQRARAKKN